VNEPGDDEPIDGVESDRIDEIDGTDLAELVDPDDDAITPTRSVDRFRKTTAGMMLAGGLIAIEEVYSGRKEREEPALIVESAQPAEPRPVEVDLDPDDPGNSTVVVRR